MKIKRLFLELILLLFSSYCFGESGIGLSSSGKDISVDMWFYQSQNKTLGLFGRYIFDTEEYQNGMLVSVCSDGAISGALGNGACSSHGGVSNVREANFSRMALSLGPTYRVTHAVQFNFGLLIGLYSSDIDIGDTTKGEFTESGLDFGVSVKPLENVNMTVFFSYETEQSRTYFGLWFPF